MGERRRQSSRKRMRHNKREKEETFIQSPLSNGNHCICIKTNRLERTFIYMYRVLEMFMFYLLKSLMMAKS